MTLFAKSSLILGKNKAAFRIEGHQYDDQRLIQDYLAIYIFGMY